MSPSAVPALPAEPGSFKAWVLAARPRTLPVSLAPVMVGTAVAVAEGGARLGPAVAAGLGAVLLQVGSNLANDVFDHENGADTADRLGPPRAAQLGLLTPRAMRGAMWGVFAAATLLGLYLYSVAGWPVLAVGAFSIAAAIAYTGGPWPFGYHGLGDPAVFLFFGIIAVVGTAFVQLGAISPLALTASLPIGALATAILVVNNLRDIETDARADKRTLAVRIGARATRREWLALVAFAYSMPVVIWLGFGTSAWVLAPIVSMPRAVSLWRVVGGGAAAADLNEALAGTAILTFLFGGLLSIGLVL